LANAATSDRVITCPIVRGEILFGIERLPQGSRRTLLADKARRLFAAVSCEGVPEAAGDHYARLKVDCQRKGLVLDENDLWIAATTMSLAAALVSSDTDFGRVDGLDVVDWTK